MRASGVKRNSEESRDRYVTDTEYHAVYKVAHKSVRLMMELAYRTLQRPESDIITWAPANVLVKRDHKVLSIKQNKTGRSIEIKLQGRLLELIDDAIGEVPKLHRPLIHTKTGEHYTYSGLDAMLRYAQTKAKEQLPELSSFGFRDLKGKGATDMWLAGDPIERIQLLCGHGDKRTTEIYVKARWRESVEHNSIQIGA